MVAALVLIAGCSSSGPRVGAAAAKQTSRPASPTPTAAVATKKYAPPTQAPVRVPVTSPDKTKAGIFVLVWFETLNYGYATGDADPLRKAVGLGCFTCANWIIEVQTGANKKMTRTGGFVHVRDLAYVDRVEDDYRFRAVLDRDPGVVTAPDGTPTAVTRGSGEVVELRVGISTSTLSGRRFWTMKSITAPTG
jgi:Family of unknown function (DUF6318)